VTPTFLYTARYQSPLRGVAPNTGAQGTLFQAAGVSSHTLTRRSLSEPYQQFRLFDPQVYLASLDVHTCAKAVAYLATYPWFGTSTVPAYRSGESSQAEWRAANRTSLLAGWRGAPPADPAEIRAAAAAAIAFQQQLGCSMLIAPSPLRVNTNRVAEFETEWWDAGIAAHRSSRFSEPLLLTLALSDPLLRDQPADTNPVIRDLLAELSARRNEVTGVFLVVNQASSDDYTVSDASIASALLYIVGELALRARMTVVVGYQGVVGTVLCAIGATAWSTGYYRSLRRLKLADYAAREGRSYPRFLSEVLAGDIGVERGIDAIWRAGRRELITGTEASESLLHSLQESSGSVVAVDWEYRPGNITAAWGHYCLVVNRLTHHVMSLDPPERLNWCGQWLARAATEVERLRGLDGFDTTASETLHQRAWSRAFDEWRAAFFS
jgi:hypothetical protein